MPWWAALLVATSATIVGYAIDAGHKELTHVFAGCYVAGCVIAVLAVRQSGIFTAVIQPPLILFCAVPGSYWLFHGGKIKNVKDLLINCGYPLIERFPLMLGTAGVVLLIGLIRWYFGMTQRPGAQTDINDDKTGESVISSITAKIASLLRGPDDDDPADGTSSTAAHAVGRTARTSPKSGRAARNGRSAQRPARTRSRHSREAQRDQNGQPAERPRRQSRRGQPRDYDAADPPRRSRRPRPQGDPDSRRQSPREARRDPYGRRSSYERPPEPFDRYDKPYGRYDSYEGYEQPRRRATPGGPAGADPSHHPISQVRYRGSRSRDEQRDQRGDEPQGERGGRPRAPRRHRAEYEI